MACKHIYKGITYNSKEEFIEKVVTPQVQTLTGRKFEKVKPVGRLNTVKKQLEELESGNIPDFFSSTTNFYGILSQNESVFQHKNQLVIWQKEEYNEKVKPYVKGESQNQHGVKFWILKDNIQKELIEEYKNKLKKEIANQPNLEREEILRVKKINEEIEKENENLKSKNQFLQLLNKDNNWVTFFVKSIIQDSSKKGYEKILFPSGNTASKIEGHTTLEEFKKQKEDRIKELEKQEIDNQNKIGSKRKTGLGEYIYTEQNYKEDKENIYTEVNQLKQELKRVETEGFGALKPIYNFYENTVTNILKKQGLSSKVITDEYGNTWNEVEVDNVRDLQNIELQRNIPQDKVDQVSKDVLVSTIEKLRRQFNLDIRFDESISVLGTVDENGVIRINPNKAKGDTPFHEVAHILVRALKEQDIKLYNSLIRELKQTSSKIIEITKSVYSDYSTERQLEEALVTLIGIDSYAKFQDKDIKISEEQKSLIQRFFDFISQFISDIFRTRDTIDLSSVATIGDLANILVAEKTIDLSKYASGNRDFQRDVNTSFSNAYNSANEVQKGVLDTINENILKYNYRVNPVTNRYESTESDVKLRRGTEVMNEMPFYSYEGESDIRNLSTNWGNIIDKLAELIFQGVSVLDATKEALTLSKEGTINEIQLFELGNAFNMYKTSRRKSVFLTQLVPFNEQEGVASAIDIIEITDKGKVIVLDVKSSKRNVKGSYFYTNKNGEKKEKSYSDSFKPGKASLKQKHEGQLSIHTGLLASKGIAVEEIKVIAAHLSEIDNNTVTKIIFENTVDNLDINLPLARKYSIDTKFKGEKITIGNETIQAQTLHEKVLLLLQVEIDNLNREGGMFSEVRKNKLEKLQNSIRGIKAGKALEAFVNEIHSMFVFYTDKEGIERDPSIVIEANRIIKTIENGEFEDDLDALYSLEAITEHIDLFRPTIEELKKFYTKVLKNSNNNVEVSSSFKKMEQIITRFDQIENKITSLVKPKVASLLGKMMHSKLKTNVQPHLDKLYAQYESESIKITRKYEIKASLATDNLSKNKISVEKIEALNKIKEKYDQAVERITSFLGDEDSIMKLLDNGYTGIDLADGWLTSAKDMPNPLLANFTKLYERKLMEVRQEVQEWGISASKIVEEFNGKITVNSANLNNEFIEERDGKLSLVGQFDLIKFDEERKEAYDRIELELEDTSAQNRAKRNWYLQNTDEVGEEDVYIENPITGEKITLIKGIETIIKEQEDVFFKEYGTKTSQRYREAMNRWLEENIKIDGGTKVYVGYQFRIPKKTLYTNERYESIQKDPIKKKYYDFIAYTYVYAHSLYPKNRGYRSILDLPGVHKDTTDRISQNGVMDYIKYSARSSFGGIIEEDVNLYGSDAYGTSKIVPMKYQDKMEISDYSRDLMASAAIYLKSAKEYKVNSSVKPLANYLTKTMSSISERRTASGEKVIRKSAEKLGLNLEKYTSNDSNITLQMLQAYIDMNIYGIRQKQEKFNIPFINAAVNGGKLANFFMNITSLTSIAASPLTALANIMQQETMVLMEAVAGEYLNMKSWKDADLEYAAREVDFIKDMTNPVGLSLINQMIDIYDAIQGNFEDHYGRDISASAAKRMMRTSTLYYMMKKGDHHTYVRAMIALMKDTKIIDAEGNELSLYDAYELDGAGIIQLKKGIKLPNSGKVHFEMKEKLDTMNRRLHGVYDKLNQPQIQRHSAGRLITMFRKFIVPGIKKRYKRRGIDHSLGNVTEGYYITFLRLLIKETRDLLNFAIRNEHNLLPEEVNNLRRFLYEAVVASLLGVAVMLLENIVDDEEDESLMYYPLYLTFRLSSEFAFFRSIEDQLRILRSPTVTYSMIERVMKFFSQLIFDPTEQYQTSSGIWEKGDSKLWAYWLKMWGFNGTTVNPDIAYKNLKRFEL
jgi:hypothetical protein